MMTTLLDDQWWIDHLIALRRTRERLIAREMNV